MKLSTDYLIIGGGAMGVAFADEMLLRSTNTENEVILVEKRAFLGGHWNDAYEFVTLHQPATYYGVASEPLGAGGRDLVSKAQIVAYYEKVLKKLKATGRFHFYPQCEYKGDGKFTSKVDSQVGYEVEVRKKTVDATYLTTNVPSTTTPQYKVGEGVTCAPINYLARLTKTWNKFVIVGSGKTGMDAVLYLMEQNVDPAKITWIMPQDAWMYNREVTFVDKFDEVLGLEMEAVIHSEDVDDMFKRLEEIGYLIRIDRKVWPTKWKGATASIEELEILRKIQNIIREGRVCSIEASRIVFENGYVHNTSVDTLHVDCTTDGLVTRAPRKIFDRQNITLQNVIVCQQLFSASLIAAIEMRCSDKDDDYKNEIVEPLPHQKYAIDLITGRMVSEKNLISAIDGVGFMWVMRNRLNPESSVHMSYYSLGKMMVRTKWYEKERREKLAGHLKKAKGVCERVVIM